MDLRQLRYFVAIADSGSITSAADVVHVAQSALSRHINLLEEELGGALLQRNARGVVVTEAGQIVLERARFILSELDNLRAEVQAHNHELVGIVRIAAPPTLAELIYIPLAKYFSEKHPRVTLRLTECLTEPAVEQLLQGALDVALVSMPSPNSHIDFTPIFREPLYVIGPPGDPILTGGPLTVSDLQHLKIVQTVEGLRRHAQKGDFPVRLANITSTIQVGNIGPLKQLVIAGLGYGIMPYSGVHEELAAGVISAAPIDEPGATRAIATWRGRPTSRAGREAIAAMIGIFKSMIKDGRILATDIWI